MSFTDKLIALKALKFEEGELSIFNIKSFIFMVNTSELIFGALKGKYGKEIDDIYYLVGKHQAYMGAKTFLEKFGYPKNINSLQTVLKQSELTGQGKGEILKADFKNKIAIFKNVNSPAAKSYRSMFGVQKTAVCSFNRGANTGGFQAFLEEGTDLLGIETKCIAKGDQYCMFEIKEKKEWDPKDPLVKEQTPKDSLDNAQLEKFTLKNILKPA